MNFITIDNFDESKLSIGGIYSATKPIQYQKIPLYYEYPTGKGPVFLRTPALYSYGVCENKDPQTQKLTGYSMSFLGFNAKNGMASEEERKFIEVTEKISKFIQDQVTKIAPLLKKGGRTKKITTEDLSIFKNLENFHGYKNKSEDLGSAPLFFGKLFAKSDKENIKITSLFYAKRTKEDIINGVKSVKGNKMLVEKNPLEYVRKKCHVIASLKIEGVFIGSQIESIQVKVPEVTITKLSPSFQSIMGEDLDLVEMEPDDEM